MRLTPAVLWRCAAVVLWMASVACLFKAVSNGVYAEEALYNPRLTAADHAALNHLRMIGDRWGTVGLILHAMAAATLALGIDVRRVARRIFVALEFVIAADGLALLLVAVIVR